jgi:hypothetical protein
MELFPVFDGLFHPCFILVTSFPDPFELASQGFHEVYRIRSRHASGSSSDRHRDIMERLVGMTALILRVAAEA